uniref:Uncharacterized protein n=1 Tax=Schistosoma japonicum TaxID=6182 RepID=C1LQN2_SCHJA|nr:hypothetical protein [Schistosoma japonicum]
MFYKKFLFLFMSSLLTCWGIDAPEYKSNTSAYPDLPEKLKILLDEVKKGLYDALIQKFKSLHEYPEHCTAVNIQENSWEEYYRLGALYATKFFQELLSIKGPDFKELSDKFKELHEKAKQLNKTKPVAHGDLEKAYPKSWKAAKLFWEAAEKFYGQVNTTEHTNEKKFYGQVNTTEHTNEKKFYGQVNTTEHTDEKGDLEKTLQNAEKNMEIYLNALKNLEQYLQASEKRDEHMTEGDLEKTLQNAEKNMEIYLNALKNLEQYLQASEKRDEHMNTMKEVELMAIEAYKKYKNTENDIQNFEEYKNVSQKLFHEIEYFVDSEGELLYRTVLYEKGLSKEKRRETDLDYYKEVAAYYSGILLV